MTHNDFTYKELLKESYGLTKKHFVFLLGVLAINLVIGWLTSGLPLVNQLISIALSVSTTCVMLLIVNGHSPVYKDMLRPFEKHNIAWRYFLATFAMYLAFILGMFIPIIGYSISKVTSNLFAFGLAGLIALALVVYYGMRLSFFGFLIIDNDNLGPIEALKKSMHITKNRFWQLAGYAGIFLLLNMAGALAFIVGLAVTLPMTWIAIALIYKKWSGQHTHAYSESGHITS